MPKEKKSNEIAKGNKEKNNQTKIQNHVIVYHKKGMIQKHIKTTQPLSTSLKKTSSCLQNNLIYLMNDWYIKDVQAADKSSLN